MTIYCRARGIVFNNHRLQGRCDRADVIPSLHFHIFAVISQRYSFLDVLDFEVS